MSPNKAVPSPWTVALLLIGAMVLPRLEADRVTEQDASSQESVWQSASVEYARQRLWNDFLDSRAETFPGRQLPGPSLTEYREYLKSMGLAATGTTVNIVVFPPLHRSHETDRIQVELSHAGKRAIELSVAVWESEDRTKPVGQLAVEPDQDGMLVCRAEPKRRSFWSYWPITPQPLLP